MLLTIQNSGQGKKKFFKDSESKPKLEHLSKYEVRSESWWHLLQKFWKHSHKENFYLSTTFLFVLFVLLNMKETWHGNIIFTTCQQALSHIVTIMQDFLKSCLWVILEERRNCCSQKISNRIVWVTRSRGRMQDTSLKNHEPQSWIRATVTTIFKLIWDSSEQR